MTERKLKTVRPRLEALVAQDRDLLMALMKEALDQILQAEMTDFLGAARGERTAAREGYRAGYYERGLVTRVGKIELRIPSLACESSWASSSPDLASSRRPAGILATPPFNCTMMRLPRRERLQNCDLQSQVFSGYHGV